MAEDVTVLQITQKELSLASSLAILSVPFTLPQAGSAQKERMYLQFSVSSGVSALNLLVST